MTLRKRRLGMPCHKRVFPSGCRLKKDPLPMCAAGDIFGYATAPLCKSDRTFPLFSTEIPVFAQTSRNPVPFSIHLFTSRQYPLIIEHASPLAAVPSRRYFLKKKGFARECLNVFPGIILPEGRVRTLVTTLPKQKGRIPNGIIESENQKGRH